MISSAERPQCIARHRRHASMPPELGQLAFVPSRAPSLGRLEPGAVRIHLCQELARRLRSCVATHLRMGGTQLPKRGAQPRLCSSCSRRVGLRRWEPPKNVSPPSAIISSRSRTVASAPSRSALLTAKTSAHSENPRLDRLHVVAHAGRHHHQRGVRGARDSRARLARLRPSRPKPRRRPTRRARAPRHAPSVTAPQRASRGQRSDEDPGIGRVALHANAIAQDGPPGKWARRVDRDNGHLGTSRAQRWMRRSMRVLLPDPGFPVMPTTQARPV